MITSRALWLLLAVAPALAAAEGPPVPYVQGNLGVFGFLDGEGIRLRSPTDRGLKLGDVMLWPSFLIEGRWDSNVFQEESDLSPTSVPVVRLVPAVALANAHPVNIGYELGAQADVRIFTSSNESLKKLTNAGVLADGRLMFLPNGAFTVSVADSFRRTLSAQNVETAATYDRNTNRAGARFDIKPGGGALDFVVGYDFVYNVFDDFDRGDYLSHDFAFRAKWRFYPKTEAFVEATMALWDWKKEPQLSGLSVDTMPLRTLVGLNGYLTKKLAVLAKVGYGNSFHDQGPSFNNAVGQLEASYTFSPTILAAVGFFRDYSPAFYSNFFVENRTYVRAQVRFLQRYAFELSGAYSYIEFAEFDPIAADPQAADDGNYTVVSHKERRDHQITAHLQLDAQITRWLGVSVGYELRSVITDFALTTTFENPGTDGPVSVVDSGDYLRHQVYASLNVSY